MLAEFKRDNADEMMDVVDADDNVMATLDKNAAYKSGHYIRIVNIAVIDPETKKVAIVRRGKTISWQPLHHAISACGHATAGESWEISAQRELEEELGVEADLEFIGKFPFKDAMGQPFMMGVFTTEIPHADLKPSPREVEDMLSLNTEELAALL